MTPFERAGPDIPEMRSDGKWHVQGRSFDTNAQAWRWIDRQEGEPVSRAEDVSDWVTRKILLG